MDKNTIQELLKKLDEEISFAKNEDELTLLWRNYLGKKGIIRDLMNELSLMSKEDKIEYGKKINELKNKIDQSINTAKDNLKTKNTSDYLNTKQVELTFKKSKVGHLHPITETINELNFILGRLGYSVYDGPEIETDEYLFQRCNLPTDHPARDLQDSIYIEEPNILLRTQTSSVESRALQNLKPPFKIVIPGRVYRNEKVKKTNHFMFHQYQLVCVQEKVSISELITTLDYLFKSFLGEDVVTRYRNKYYPEVEPGIGPDMRCFNCGGEGCVVCKKRGWIEMAGAGIIHPNMMKLAGIDTEKWQGFAFGLGLDRWVMARYKITDIRTLLGGNLSYKPFVR